MNPNSSISMWRVKPCSPALVLLVDSDEKSIWQSEVRNLVSDLRNRLPRVQISSVAADVPHGLQSALAAAAFRGASSAVVVKLWGLEHTSIGHTETVSTNLRLDVFPSESPPDVEAIAASYHAAWLAQAPMEGFLPCN